MNLTLNICIITCRRAVLQVLLQWCQTCGSLAFMRTIFGRTQPFGNVLSTQGSGTEFFDIGMNRTGK